MNIKILYMYGFNPVFVMEYTCMYAILALSFRINFDKQQYSNFNIVPRLENGDLEALN